MFYNAEIRVKHCWADQSLQHFYEKAQNELNTHKRCLETCVCRVEQASIKERKTLRAKTEKGNLYTSFHCSDRALAFEYAQENDTKCIRARFCTASLEHFES
jgi:hypothetical protein